MPDETWPRVSEAPDAWWDDLWGQLTEKERGIIREMVRWEQHKFLTRLADNMADVTQVVHEMNAKGEVGLKLTIAQPQPYEPMTVITAQFSQKRPGPKPLGAWTFYKDGVFTENDPRQAELPEGRRVEREADVRSVGERRAELRRVGSSERE